MELNLFRFELGFHWTTIELIPKVKISISIYDTFHNLHRTHSKITIPVGFPKSLIRWKLSFNKQQFQRVLDHILTGLPVFSYLDDILVYSQNKEEHIKTLDEVFKRLQDNGLTLSLPKCEFGKSEVDFLGYRVNKDGICPLLRKVQAITEIPPPQKPKELLSYLGMINFYRHTFKKLPPTNTCPYPRTTAEILQCLYTLATSKITAKKFQEMWKNNGQ